MALAITAKVSWIHTWKVGISVGHSKFPSMDFVSRFCRFSIVDGRDHPRIATLHQLKLISNCCACAEEEMVLINHKREVTTQPNKPFLSHTNGEQQRERRTPQDARTAMLVASTLGCVFSLLKKGSLDHFQVALTPMSSPPATPVKRRSRVVYVPDFAA